MYGTSSLTIVQTTVYKRNKKWERYRNKTSAPEGSKGEVRRETGDIDSKKYSPVKGGIVWWLKINHEQVWNQCLNKVIKMY